MQRTPKSIVTQQNTQQDRLIADTTAKIEDENRNKIIMVATISEIVPNTTSSIYSSMTTSILSSLEDKAHFWLADSASSSHLSDNLSSFQSIQDTSPVTIQTASGEKFTANQRVTIHIRITCDPNFQVADVPITLTDVIYSDSQN